MSASAVCRDQLLRRLFRHRFSIVAGLFVLVAVALALVVTGPVAAHGPPATDGPCVSGQDVSGQDGGGPGGGGQDGGGSSGGGGQDGGGSSGGGGQDGGGRGGGAKGGGPDGGRAASGGAEPSYVTVRGGTDREPAPGTVTVVPGRTAPPAQVGTVAGR